MVVSELFRNTIKWIRLKSFYLILFKENPIGNTDHFTWFITDIGVVAVFKESENYEIYNSNVEKEANNIALDITKEEKEYIQINDKKLFLFYS